MPLHEPHPGTRARRALGTLGRAARLTLAGCVALAMACTSSGDGTAPSGNAVLPFHVSFGAGVPVATLVVTVTGAGIAPPLVYNMPIVGGGANGTITVPVGAARTILAEAFDTSGVVIFSGSTTVNVVAGTNPTVSFLLTSGLEAPARRALAMHYAQLRSLEPNKTADEVDTAGILWGIDELLRLPRRLIEMLGDDAASEALHTASARIGRGLKSPAGSSPAAAGIRAALWPA